MEVVYEDNHIIIVNKQSGEIVQGDKTGDRPLSETVKEYIKVKYHKPGNVFLGVVHRLDRPVSGLVVFAKTSKALARLNEMFRKGDVHKTYWAIVKNTPTQSEAELNNWIVRNEKQNKSYAYDHEVKNSKNARLRYSVLARTDRYTLLEVHLMTGRHLTLMAAFPSWPGVLSLFIRYLKIQYRWKPLPHLMLCGRHWPKAFDQECRYRLTL